MSRDTDLGRAKQAIVAVVDCSASTSAISTWCLLMRTDLHKQNIDRLDAEVGITYLWMLFFSSIASRTYCAIS